MTKQSPVHWTYWIVAVFALLWNALGGVNFMMQMNPEIVSELPATHRAIIDTRPAWATAGFAVAVFGGALGGLLLLLRKSAALYLFVASLIGAVVATAHSASVTGSTRFTTMEIVVMMVLPVLVAAYLIWYAMRAQRKGWVS